MIFIILYIFICQKFYLIIFIINSVNLTDEINKINLFYSF